MGSRGPAPKLAVVRQREGNTNKAPIPEGVHLPPEAPPEPDWAEIFPSEPLLLGEEPLPEMLRLYAEQSARLRRHAAEAWGIWVSALDPVGILARSDFASLEAACIAWARFSEDQAHGTAINACRWLDRWIALSGKLGLTPSARDQMNPREKRASGADFD